MPEKSVAHKAAREVPPLWIRVPVAVKQFGVCRAKLYCWITDGRVRSAHIREPNAKRGIRLIEAASLNSFIDGQARGGATNERASREALVG